MNSNDGRQIVWRFVSDRDLYLGVATIDELQVKAEEGRRKKDKREGKEGDKKSGSD